MAEFRKPSPEMETVYTKITALAGEGVWVPATSNGGLRQLLAEMETRGWKIIPPAPARPCTCGQGLWLDHEQGPYCG